MANYTKLDDTLSGSEGKGFITRSRANREMFEISKIDAHVTLSVTEKKLLGHRMKQHKVVGATGEGSGTFYFMNSDALKEFINYKKNGIYPACTLQFTNEDPAVYRWQTDGNTVPCDFKDDSGCIPGG